MSDDEDNTCPLCMEEYNQDDLRLRPCPCGYQVCLWCLRKLQDMSGKCPACRATYEEENITYRSDAELAALTRGRGGGSSTAPSAPASSKSAGRGAAQGRGTAQGRAAAARAAAAVTAKYGKKQQLQPSSRPSAGRTAAMHRQHPQPLSMEERKRLANMRVIQRTLLYVIGIAPKIAKEEVLRRKEYFGQYGEVKKIVVNRNVISGGHNSASAYVTFARPVDACEAIRCVDGCFVMGRQMRASYGTTKYCNAFLRGAGCPNPDCLYLHSYGDEGDSFTKEEMLRNKGVFQAQINPKQQQQQSSKQGGSAGSGKLTTGLPPPSAQHQKFLRGGGVAKRPAAAAKHSAGGGSRPAGRIPADVAQAGGARRQQHHHQQQQQHHHQQQHQQRQQQATFAAKAAAAVQPPKGGRGGGRKGGHSGGAEHGSAAARSQRQQQPQPQPQPQRPQAQGRGPPGGTNRPSAQPSQSSFFDSRPARPQDPRKLQEQLNMRPLQSFEDLLGDDDDYDGGGGGVTGGGPGLSGLQGEWSRPLAATGGKGGGGGGRGFTEDDFPGLPSQRREPPPQRQQQRQPQRQQQRQPAPAQSGFVDTGSAQYQEQHHHHHPHQQHHHQQQRHRSLLHPELDGDEDPTAAPPGFYDALPMRQRPMEDFNFQQQKLLQQQPAQPAAAAQWLQSMLPGVNVTFGATPPGMAQPAAGRGGQGNAGAYGQIRQRQQQQQLQQHQQQKQHQHQHQGVQPAVEDGAADAWGFGDLPDVSQLLHPEQPSRAPLNGSGTWATRSVAQQQQQQHAAPVAHQQQQPQQPQQQKPKQGKSKRRGRRR